MITMIDDFKQRFTLGENFVVIADDAKWDGLKGYITNTVLDAEKVIAEYHGLWVVERAFRISKESLEMRPMFHFTERRIEAHICICFIAYKVYKELERIIKMSNIDMSVGHILDTAKTITTIRVKSSPSQYRSALMPSLGWG